MPEQTTPKDPSSRVAGFLKYAETQPKKVAFEKFIDDNLWTEKKSDDKMHLIAWLESVALDGLRDNNTDLVVQVVKYIKMTAWSSLDRDLPALRAQVLDTGLSSLDRIRTRVYLLTETAYPLNEADTVTAKIAEERLALSRHILNLEGNPGRERVERARAHYLAAADDALDVYEYLLEKGERKKALGLLTSCHLDLKIIGDRRPDMLERYLANWQAVVENPDASDKMETRFPVKNIADANEPTHNRLMYIAYSLAAQEFERKIMREHSPDTRISSPAIEQSVALFAENIKHIIGQDIQLDPSLLDDNFVQAGPVIFSKPGGLRDRIAIGILPSMSTTPPTFSIGCYRGTARVNFDDINDWDTTSTDGAKLRALADHPETEDSLLTRVREDYPLSGPRYSKINAADRAATRAGRQHYDDFITVVEGISKTTDDRSINRTLRGMQRFLEASAEAYRAKLQL